MNKISQGWKWIQLFWNLFKNRKQNNYSLERVEYALEKTRLELNAGILEQKSAQEAIMLLNNWLDDSSCNYYTSNRWGATHDGGYFVPVNIPYINSICAGIGKNSKFEQDLASSGIKVLALDPTVDLIPHNHINITHEKLYLRGGEGLIPGTSVSLKDCFVSQGNQLDALVKIDIEGDELEVILGSREVLPRASVLIIEFHNLHRLVEVGYRELFLNCINLLMNNFVATNFHSNNWRNFVQFGSILIPEIFELTMVNRKYAHRLQKQNTPLRMFANNPRRLNIYNGIVSLDRLDSIMDDPKRKRTGERA